MITRTKLRKLKKSQLIDTILNLKELLDVKTERERMILDKVQNQMQEQTRVDSP